MLKTLNSCSKHRAFLFTAPTQLPELNEYQNHTVVKHNHTLVQQCIQQNQTPWKTLTIIFGLLNAVLVVVVIGEFVFLNF